MYISIYIYIYMHTCVRVRTCWRTRAWTQRLGQFTPPVKYDVTINFVPSIDWSIASSIITIVRLSRLWAVTMLRYNSQVIIRAVCVSSRITSLHWQKTFINYPCNFIYEHLIEIFSISRSNCNVADVIYLSPSSESEAGLLNYLMLKIK